LIYKLGFSSGTTVETTWNHPFWVSSTGTSTDSTGSPTTGSVSDISSLQAGKWIEAKDLQIGDESILQDGRLTQIQSIQQVHVPPTKVYNIEVEDFHTYFVGEDGVSVHNDSYGNNLNRVLGAYYSKDPNASAKAELEKALKDPDLSEAERTKLKADLAREKELALKEGFSKGQREYQSDEAVLGLNKDSQTANDYLNAGKEQLNRIGNFFSNLNPFGGDLAVDIQRIKQSELDNKPGQSTNSGCVVAGSTILMSSELGRNLNVREVNSVGQAMAQITPNYSVVNTDLIATKFGIAKPITISNVKPGSDDMQNQIDKQLKSGKPVGIYLNSTQSTDKHFEIVTGKVKVGKEQMYKVHDVGYQKDVYMKPSTGEVFKLDSKGSLKATSIYGTTDNRRVFQLRYYK